MTDMFFEAGNFNGNISSWSVENVKSMIRMFYNAGNFKQNISKWLLNDNVQVEYMLFNSGIADDKSKWPEKIRENDDYSRDVLGE